jgi:hypothetical protein
MADTQIPAGWYADPAGDTTKLRYWDGVSWTEQTCDATALTGQVSQPMTAPANPYAQPTAPPPANPYQQGIPGAPGVQPGKDRSGLATGALVCGIVGIPGALLLALIGYVLGIIAIVLGVRSRSSSKKTLATAGIILGVVTLVVALINSILGVMLFSGATFSF